MVEVRKSEVATQLRDSGVARGHAVLKKAMEAVAAEMDNAAVKQMKADLEAAKVAEAMARRTPAVLAQVKHILRAPNILDEMVAVTSALGHVGEEPMRALVFLSAVAGMTARTHDDTIHLILKGPSSGGKNAVIKRVLELLPQGTALVVSNTTHLGLIYLGVSFPLLVFQEFEGVKGAHYVVRQIMSEGKVTRITAKGMFTTVFKTSVITTTTRKLVHPENETRAYSITISDDPDLTRRVIEAEAQTAAGMARPAVDGTLLLAWREALAQLAPGAVIVPFAEELAKTFSYERVRARRDFLRSMNLIRACALLHQNTRQRDKQGRVIAKPHDHEMVKPILTALRGAVEPLTIQGEQVLALLGDLAEGEGGWVERGAMVERAVATGIATEKTVRTWCERFAGELGLWDVRGHGGRLEYRRRDGQQ
jgi:DNA replicative helicase MCM subunit Mcm2 (Cdc46/Mcm family)